MSIANFGLYSYFRTIFVRDGANEISINNNNLTQKRVCPTVLGKLVVLKEANFYHANQI